MANLSADARKKRLGICELLLEEKAEIFMFNSQATKVVSVDLLAETLGVTVPALDLQLTKHNIFTFLKPGQNRTRYLPLAMYIDALAQEASGEESVVPSDQIAEGMLLAQKDSSLSGKEKAEIISSFSKYGCALLEANSRLKHEL